MVLNSKKTYSTIILTIGIDGDLLNVMALSVKR